MGMLVQQDVPKKQNSVRLFALEGFQQLLTVISRAVQVRRDQ